MIGFRLSELVVSGTQKQDARIPFGAGCNILTGPSNTGKSYIVECIDFILGGETIPGEDIGVGLSRELRQTVKTLLTVR